MDVEAERGEKPRRAAVDVVEGMDVNELELSDARFEDRVDAVLRTEPAHHFRHHPRYVGCRRRRVDDLARLRVDDVVLPLPIFARQSLFVPHAFDEPLVDLPDERFRDRIAAVQIIGQQVEGPAVVQKLARVVGIGPGDFLAREQLLRLLQRRS